MKKIPKSLQLKLQNRIDSNSLRQLPLPNNLIDFSSNDYLGFALNEDIFHQTHAFLLQNDCIVNGATGSRLLSGNHQLYSITESFISNFHQSEAVLLFNSGYDANIGLFSSILQRDDIIVYDELCHASIRDGIKLSNAKAYKFKHNDLEDLERLLSQNQNKQVYIATESVFSMDGDSPDLERMVQLSEKYASLLIVDEAHSLGVFGTNGVGVVQHLNLHNRVFARVVTYGKALGCHGSAILGSNELVSYLVNFARSFIYTTGLAPHAVATILMAYQKLESNNELLKLENNIHFFKKTLDSLNLNVSSESSSAIQSIIVSGNENVKSVSDKLKQKGFEVKPILSPTVPVGQERLRFCIHSYNSEIEMQQVLLELKSILD